MHRQLQRRGLADPALLPVEVLYLKAMNEAQSSPAAAIRMLESLVNLYSVGDPAAQGDERRQMCVQLAERQIAQLREDDAKLAARQLSAIQERLALADKLAKTRPDEARPIYQAIVDLYESQAWAKPVVDVAKRKLNPNE
jgi:hypothetical protein